MSNFMIGNNVRFYLRHADKDLAKPSPDVILKGKIVERARSGGYLIKVYDDNSISSNNGTLCNRAESDIIEVIE